MRDATATQPIGTDNTTGRTGLSCPDDTCRAAYPLRNPAYAAGFHTFLWTRQRLAPSAFKDKDEVAWIAVGAIVGAALGAKLSCWLDDPLTAFQNFPDWRHLLQGKSIIGDLLGVQWCKRITGIRQSIGDAFVLPLTVGICIGRMGRYLAGLDNHTYGIPTSLPWGVDFRRRPNATPP